MRTVKKSYRSVHAPWQVVEFGTEIEIMNRNDNSAPSDIGKAAERRLTRFDYVDGGVVTGCRIKQNVEELASLNLRQRVLSGALAPSVEDR